MATGAPAYVEYTAAASDDAKRAAVADGLRYPTRPITSAAAFRLSRA